MSLDAISAPQSCPPSTICYPNSVNPIRVKKRDGTLVPVNPNKIINLVTKCSKDLNIDPKLVTEKAIMGLFDGVSTQELDSLLIQNAAMQIAYDPEYSKLSARLLSHCIDDELVLLGVHSFMDSIQYGFDHGIIAADTYEMIKNNQESLEEAIDFSNTDLFEYFGLRTVYDRYLLKDPQSRMVFESPQYFFMRVACGLADNSEEAKEFYKLISSFDYMPSTPTLFNSGTRRSQMSSCYLLDSPKDSLESIYDKYKDVALLSKFAGGIGLAYHRIRSRGSLIKGTNGKSNGIIPFLKTLDSSVSAVNQGGKRKGAACIYLETWHADILDFLSLRDNTGDEAQRTHNLNLANWIPDLFMKRVDANSHWSLFDPSVVPDFSDLYGEDFEKAYLEAEKNKLYSSQINARDLYGAMMKTLAQTGNGWITFKDSSNLKANQTGKKENVIHLSNLCTEIIEVTSDKETAVCNLGSVNLKNHVINNRFDFEKLAKTVTKAIKYLDRVIDINFYPISDAKDSNSRWRPVGLGIMGLQDTFFLLGYSFDSENAKTLSKKIQETIYFYALKESNRLAKKFGTHGSYEDTKIAQGLLQFDLWKNTLASVDLDWLNLRSEIEKHGVRNSLLIAIAPTATISSICGVYECIEPQISNLFKRETLSGEFLQVNKYLIARLKEHDLWTESIRNQIKLNNGSIQNIAEIPSDIRNLFKTAWEIPMRALIDMAADRGSFIDQSQSLNLFIEKPTIGKLSSMYRYAWQKGLKTTYYLRSRSATQINKTTVSSSSVADAVACSLENPDACESCQ